MTAKGLPDEIKGELAFPEKWTVFGPFDGANPDPPAEALKQMPAELSVEGKTAAATEAVPTRCQYDFASIIGKPPFKKPQSVFVFVPLHSDTEQDATLGFGADWFFRAWLNGEPVIDLLAEGNDASPPAINNHCVDVRLKPSENVLAVHLVHGKGGAMLALGGPEELRRGDFRSILPPPDKELDAAGLLERYPADPEAPMHWVMPEGFDPRVPGLGMRKMEEAEHFDLLRCLKSKSPADEGGTGVYESPRHGTWNHNNSVFVFKDRLLGIWHNHALDENGPGSRVLARVGKVLNERGEVDWGGEENLLELAPAAVPVRRRLLHSDEDAVRDAQAVGGFRVVDDRLIFCGRLQALHGVTTRIERGIPWGEVLAPEEYAHAHSPDMPGAKFAVWLLDFKFYQEWGVRDDKFQPLSPIYKEKDLAPEIQMTTELRLPLEPLLPPYRDAPLLADAPADFQELVRKSAENGDWRKLSYRPGTAHLTVDGTNGLVHGSQFRRPDGSWVAVRENQQPRVQPFFYAAEKPDAESYYPPARRSNVYGAVNPASGQLADGQVYLVANSPNRQNMYITMSRDGRLFDRSWFLRHERLSDFTPGAMKNEGGPGSGPQYFKPALIGESLWLVYSISKEHVGATRVPVPALG